MTSRILSTAIFIWAIFGAYLETSSRTAGMACNIFSKICILPTFACAKAFDKISLLIPLILISICSAQIPASVPATLKSISPKWSSIPWISVKIV